MKIKVESCKLKRISPFRIHSKQIYGSKIMRPLNLLFFSSHILRTSINHEFLLDISDVNCDQNFENLLKNLRSKKNENFYSQQLKLGREFIFLTKVVHRIRITSTITIFYLTNRMQLMSLYSSSMIEFIEIKLMKLCAAMMSIIHSNVCTISHCTLS